MRIQYGRIIKIDHYSGILETILFVADGNEPAVMYLDKIEFEVKEQKNPPAHRLVPTA